jgi:uncharacterized protein (DUF608 family)
MSKLIPNFQEFINEAAKYTDDKSIAVLAMNGLSLRDQIHVFHWQTEVGDQHKALGDYYDDFLEQLDGLMEVVMGKYGRFSVKSVGTPAPLVDLKDVNVEEFVSSKVSIFVEAKKIFAKDPEILNIIDEVIAEIQKLKYLLTMS